MLKSSLALQPNRFGEATIAASRKVWLASLGAAVVTRDWVQSEAGDAFKTWRSILTKAGSMYKTSSSGTT